MNPTTPTPLTKKQSNTWNTAALIALIGGHVLVLLGGLLFATYLVTTIPASGSQAGWNVLAFVILPFQAINIGYGSIFAIAAGALSIAGLMKNGKNTFGIVLLIISGLFSLKIFTLIENLLSSVGL